MNEEQKTHRIEITVGEALLILAFSIIPWTIGMLDICNSFWNYVLR